MHAASGTLTRTLRIPTVQTPAIYTIDAQAFHDTSGIPFERLPPH